MIIDTQSKNISGVLSVMFIEDHDYMICYAPALNLSGYGKTLDEAKDMFLNVVLDDYYDTLICLPPAAIFEELSKYGWVSTGRTGHDFKNTSYVDKEGVLRNFNLPSDTPVVEQELTLA